MQMRQRILTSLFSLLLVLLLPAAYGFHHNMEAAERESKQQQDHPHLLKRQVRAAEAPPIQPQQGDDQSSSGTDAEEVLGRQQLPASRLLSMYPLYGRYLVNGGVPARWLTGIPLDTGRSGRADSNFIRFGRSSSSSSYPGSIFYRAGSKKNNFIRLGRENPRQNNFIRLGRSGTSWESMERPQQQQFLPSVYSRYYTPTHWSHFSDPAPVSNDDVMEE